MSESFIGEIRCFASSYVPLGWLSCDGSLYATHEYQALYALIGNTFGGSYNTGNFGVPDLRGRAVAGAGTGTGTGIAFPRVYGHTYGNKAVPLAIANLPNHEHTLQRISAKYVAKTSIPSATSEFGNLEKSDLDIANLFIPDTTPANTALAAGTIAPAGLGEPVSTLPPYSAMYYGICCEGVWPPRP